MLSLLIGIPWTLCYYFLDLRKKSWASWHVSWNFEYNFSKFAQTRAITAICVFAVKSRFFLSKLWEDVFVVHHEKGKLSWCNFLRVEVSVCKLQLFVSELLKWIFSFKVYMYAPKQKGQIWMQNFYPMFIKQVNNMETSIIEFFMYGKASEEK